MTPPPPDRYGAFVERLTDGPSGRRVAVKDMIAVRGCSQRAGLRGRIARAQEDAAPVAKLRAAGFAIVGTTVSDAAGFGTMTNLVENPVAPSRAVGGSSGGAAAAVAGGLADLGLGTDTGGSVRIPAAYCGLYAYKPSAGRIASTGVLALSKRFDAVGLLARDPKILVEAARVLIDDHRCADEAAATIVVSQDAHAASDEDVERWLVRLTPNLERRKEPFPYDAMAFAHSTIVCAEGLAVHRDHFDSNPGDFPSEAASALAYAKTLGAQEVLAARATVAQATGAWRNALRPGEIMIMPTLPMAPLSRYASSATVRGEPMPPTNANVRLTLFANVTGLPVVVAPVAGHSMQFVGAFGSDEMLLDHAPRLAAELESG